jgi:integrase
MTVIRFIVAQQGHWQLSTTKGALASIAFVHRMKGQPDPTKDGAVALALDGLRRREVAKLVREGPAPPGARDDGKAVPASPTDVDAVARAGLRPTATKIEVRDAAMAVLAFYIIARPAAIAILRREFFIPHVGGIAVRVPPVKKETAFRERVILRGRDPQCCPVLLLEKYLALAKPKVMGPFFNSMVGGAALDPSTVGGRIGEALRRWSARVAPFTGYSPRRGAMTHGDRRGLSGEVLKRFGGWKSAAFEGYIDPADEPVLRVAAALGERL